MVLIKTHSVLKCSTVPVLPSTNKLKRNAWKSIVDIKSDHKAEVQFHFHPHSCNQWCSLKLTQCYSTKLPTLANKKVENEYWCSNASHHIWTNWQVVFLKMVWWIMCLAEELKVSGCPPCWAALKSDTLPDWQLSVCSTLNIWLLLGVLLVLFVCLYTFNIMLWWISLFSIFMSFLLQLRL